MRSTRSFVWISLIALLAASLACNFSVSVNQGSDNSPTAAAPDPSSTTVLVEVVDTLAPTSVPPTAVLGDTGAETPAPPQATAAPAATRGPECRVLTELNLRSGPGTAYNPPLRALPKDTILIPIGYNPTGPAGGSWAQVRVQPGGEVGWVSAGAQFISCSIDLAGLPAIEVEPPPAPKPPVVQNLPPDGSFPENWVWDIIYTKGAFVQFKVRDPAVGKKDGSGIAEVSFTVTNQNGKAIYTHSEQTAGFCIFGGGEPDCNPWTMENGVYKWEPGGREVKNGEFTLAVVVQGKDGTQGNWNIPITVTLP